MSKALTLGNILLFSTPSLVLSDGNLRRRSTAGFSSTTHNCTTALKTENQIQQNQTMELFGQHYTILTILKELRSSHIWYQSGHKSSKKHLSSTTNTYVFRDFHTYFHLLPLWTWQVDHHLPPEFCTMLHEMLWSRWQWSVGVYPSSEGHHATCPPWPMLLYAQYRLLCIPHL